MVHYKNTQKIKDCYTKLFESYLSLFEPKEREKLECFNFLQKLKK